LLIIETASVV